MHSSTILLYIIYVLSPHTEGDFHARSNRSGAEHCSSSARCVCGCCLPLIAGTHPNAHRGCPVAVVHEERSVGSPGSILWCISFLF